jgi:hypothetical protein
VQASRQESIGGLLSRLPLEPKGSGVGRRKRLLRSHREHASLTEVDVLGEDAGQHIYAGLSQREGESCFAAGFDLREVEQISELLRLDVERMRALALVDEPDLHQASS